MIGSPPLPPAFLNTPLAHRGLHDQARGRPENSLSAFAAAVEAGYGIELDVQPSSDGVAKVFHDHTLDRMTGTSGRVDARPAAELARIALKTGGEAIPRLRDVLTLVAGRVPVLIELKDQSGNLSSAHFDLEQAVAADLADYAGDVAVMSYNPSMVASLTKLAPTIPRGLVTEAYLGPHHATVPNQVLEELLQGPNLAKIGGAFVSHDVNDLDRPWLAQYRQDGCPVLCWTVKSEEQEVYARLRADNVTFEGYLAQHGVS